VAAVIAAAEVEAAVAVVVVVAIVNIRARSARDHHRGQREQRVEAEEE